jgi:dipeptidyl-peptidase-3
VTCIEYNNVFGVMQAYNTRLFKKSLTDKSVVYELAIASAEVKPRVSHVFQSEQKSINIDVIYGDHSPFMARLADCIEKAKEFVPEDRTEQKSMLTEYVKHFRGGAISAHKDSQRNWVKDRAPPVETNIGFIESYRDPFGVRGEFEGFVAVVNREQSKKFQILVDNAQPFIAMLPWPSAFEKDQFLRPGRIIAVFAVSMEHFVFRQSIS